MSLTSEQNIKKACPVHHLSKLSPTPPRVFPPLSPPPTIVKINRPL